MTESPEYTPNQVSAYLDRIQFPKSEHSEDPLMFLTQILRKQLAHVPFETLELHYSKDKNVSVKLEDLYHKLVIRRRGGYCLENNALFGAMLRSLGFHVVGVICRISMNFREVTDGSWLPMSHMANLVTINNQRYMVDVGYGPDGPCTPLPLTPDEIRDGLPDQKLKLEYKSIPQHRDSSQRVWMLSSKRGLDGPWEEVYHFPDIEFLPCDYEVLNDHVMARSIWATTVLAQRFVLGSDGFTLTGNLLLVRDEVRSGNCPSKRMALIKKLDSERTRVEALKENFGICLTEEEEKAIMGRATELISLSESQS